MKGEITKQQLDYMRKDDPIAAVIWQGYIEKGEAVLVEGGDACPQIT
jgi:hypothetical protein